MSNLERELSSVFPDSEPPEDNTGALHLLLHHLQPLRARLIFVVDEQGCPLVMSHLDTSIEWKSPMAEELVDVADAEEGSFPLLPNEKKNSTIPGPLFAIQLTGSQSGRKKRIEGYLGIVTDTLPDAFTPEPTWCAALKNAIKLAWTSLRTEMLYQKECLRSKHLSAEKEMLKQTHRDLVGTVLEEREERIQEKREHILQLESKVKERSEQLRVTAARAESANEAKSEFLANMSHEIRTPITAVLGYTDLLLEKSYQESEISEYLDIIQRNSNHLLVLINDILDVSKLEAGKLSVEKIPCSPDVIVEDVATLMKVKADDKNIEFITTIDEEIPPSIMSDPTRIRQILINLVGNAIKFTSKGSVRLDVKKLPSPHGVARLEFAIKDTGIGLSDDQIKKIFKPFTQADYSTTRQFGGTGLGLTISKRLSNLLGGDLHVRSTEGEGSTFAFHISAVIATARETNRLGPRGAIPAKPSPSQTVSGRVLLVDDGRDNQRLISTLLTRAGAEVEIAENGQIAIEKAEGAVSEGKEFDIILMDMQMPVMDGYTATSILRSRGFEVPIVALTGHAMSGDREKCLNAGCTEYMTKPIQKKRLLETIGQFVRSSIPSP